MLAHVVEKAVKLPVFLPAALVGRGLFLLVERDYARNRQGHQRRIMLSGVILCCRI